MSAPERRDPQDAVFAPEELLRALPTPCYVYDEAQLRTRAFGLIHVPHLLYNYVRTRQARMTGLPLC